MTCIGGLHTEWETPALSNYIRSPAPGGADLHPLLCLAVPGLLQHLSEGGREGPRAGVQLLGAPRSVSILSDYSSAVAHL